MQIVLSIYLNSSTCKYLSLDNGATMTSKRRENINLVSFICPTFITRLFRVKPQSNNLSHISVNDRSVAQQSISGYDKTYPVKQ